jgi:hypothetical protein
MELGSAQDYLLQLLQPVQFTRFDFDVASGQSIEVIANAIKKDFWRQDDQVKDLFLSKVSELGKQRFIYDAENLLILFDNIKQKVPLGI